MNKKLQNTFWQLIKWVTLLSAYTYLTVKLIQFDQYEEFWAYWHHITFSDIMWLLVVFILLPFNWFFESTKWQRIVSNSEELPLIKSFQSILAGFATGFFTPNRTGDFIGRILYLKKANRKTGIIYSLINSLTQNLVLIICGVPASIIYFVEIQNVIDVDLKVYYWALIAIVLCFTALYFALPGLAKTKLWLKYLSFSSDITQYSNRDLILILFYSLVRYGIFCIQFYAILQFFGVDMQAWQALLAIPTNYLFVTFTPSLAFSEAAIRGSYAVFFISAFSPQVAGIAFAGISLWLINFGIPMLAGSVLLVKKK